MATFSTRKTSWRRRVDWDMTSDKMPIVSASTSKAFRPGAPDTRALTVSVTAPCTSIADISEAQRPPMERSCRPSAAARQQPAAGPTRRWWLRHAGCTDDGGGPERQCPCCNYRCPGADFVFKFADTPSGSSLDCIKDGTWSLKKIVRNCAVCTNPPPSSCAAWAPRHHALRWERVNRAGEGVRVALPTERCQQWAAPVLRRPGALLHQVQTGGGGGRRRQR